MGYPPFDHNWIRKIIELQQQLSWHYDPIANAIKQQQQILDHLKVTEVTYLFKDLQYPNLKDFLTVAGIEQNILSLQEQIANSLGSISAMSTELNYLKSAGLFESVLASQERLYRMQEEYVRYVNLIKLPTDRIESVLATAEASARFWNLPDFYNELTLAFVKEYQTFINRQFKRLSYDSVDIAERRVKVTDFSGGLFEAVNASLEISRAIENDIGHKSIKYEAVTSKKSGLYSHVNQHLGFVYSDRFDGDVEVSFNRSIPARLVYLGYSIIEQIYKINTFSEREKQFLIFKPTTRTMHACGIIASHIASDENTFNLLIDQLYFLLYEGSGSAKRLIPIASDSNLQPIWTLKHLRLSARHDVDHGDRLSIQEKRMNIRNAFTFLLGKVMPITPGDWQRAQLRLYEEIDLMLKTILESMQKQTKKEDR